MTDVAQHKVEALVIGGGLAGSALAMRLAACGRQVRLIERQTGPHDKVCGEFLSYETVAGLCELGADPDDLGAVPIHALRLAGRSSAVTAALPFRAKSLSRRVLDEELLRRAALQGVDVVRGSRIVRLENAAGGWHVEDQSGATTRAETVFLATGKHDLRGWQRPPGRQNDLIGFKMHFDLRDDQRAGLDGHVELALFEGGYAGLEPIEGGKANLCLVIRREEFARAGGDWPALLKRMSMSCPHLAQRMDGVRPCTERPLAIAAIPYGYVTRAETVQRDGVWRIGDQAAVIPSFSGDGMAIALYSAATAARHYLAGHQPRDYHADLLSSLQAQVRRATFLSQMLVLGLGQSAVLGAVRLAPWLMSAVAGATRLSKRALEDVRTAPG